MTRLLSLLLALCLAAATPAIAGEGSGAARDCMSAASESAGEDEDCCAGKESMSACILACAICPPSAPSAAWRVVASDVAAAPWNRDAPGRELVVRPPDTAPPKFLFA